MYQLRTLLKDIAISSLPGNFLICYIHLLVLLKLMIIYIVFMHFLETHVTQHNGSKLLINCIHLVVFFEILLNKFAHVSSMHYEFIDKPSIKFIASKCVFIFLMTKGVYIYSHCSHLHGVKFSYGVCYPHSSCYYRKPIDFLTRYIWSHANYNPVCKLSIIYLFLLLPTYTVLYNDSVLHKALCVGLCPTHNVL